jgi:hypothetical protein
MPVTVLKRTLELAGLVVAMMYSSLQQIAHDRLMPLWKDDCRRHDNRRHHNIGIADLDHCIHPAGRTVEDAQDDIVPDAMEQNQWRDIPDAAAENREISSERMTDVPAA